MKTLLEAATTGKRYRHNKCKAWCKFVKDAIRHAQVTLKLSDQDILKAINQEVWEVEE